MLNLIIKCTIGHTLNNARSHPFSPLICTRERISTLNNDRPHPSSNTTIGHTPLPSHRAFSRYQISWRGIPPTSCVQNTMSSFRGPLLQPIVICLQAELAQYRRHNVLGCSRYNVLYMRTFWSNSSQRQLDALPFLRPFFFFLHATPTLPPVSRMSKLLGAS